MAGKARRATTSRHTASDDEQEPESSRSAAAQARRGTRACDRCRKIKSRCESIDSDKCKNCVAAGLICAFEGPTFKRGPPKGYIHAIEQRWHQVECLLATIIASPRAQDIVNDLRQDHMARMIFDRVESGPYGAIGRAGGQQQAGEGLYSTIMTQSGQAMGEDSRPKRQSRMSREIVSSQASDAAMTTPPTAEWQDQLFKYLSAEPTFTSPTSNYVAASPEQPSRTAWSSPEQPSPAVIPGNLSEVVEGPSRIRRRLEGPSTSILPPQWQDGEGGWAEVPQHTGSGMNTPGDDPPELHHEEEYDEAMHALGHLSVDNNKEFRYHGRSAGLHLLAKSDRTDDDQQEENGIWKFNTPRHSTAADCHCLSFQRVNECIPLPDIAKQDRLITIYFTHVHYFFPVIHRATFLATYNERNVGSHSSANRREPMQTVTKLLLFAMFAIAARYDPEEFPLTGGGSIEKQLEAGREYATNARRLLNTVYEDSRPSVCQALLLLGIREFGIGSAAQGWLWTGMGCRMAIDVGMNQDADKWKDARGNDIFTPIEKQIRRQIWWSCCIADKLSAIWLGRSIMYRTSDFDVAEPDLDLNEDQQLWRPYPRDALGPEFEPMPALVMTCMRAGCKLSVIISEIMRKVYPVKWLPGVARRTTLDQLESEVHKWMIDLPDELRYHESESRVTAAPQVLVLHAEYYCALLLLYRAFLPLRTTDPDLHSDPLHSKCFDVCQGAAAKVSSIITAFHTTFNLRRGPPFLMIYLQCTGIMHIVTLQRRPRDTQATVGLLQCIHAAEEMQDVWPAARQLKNLLKGAKVQMDDLTALSETASRPKRTATEAMMDTPLGPELMRPSPHAASYASLQGPSSATAGPSSTPGLDAFDVPTTNPSPPYFPPYEWWPILSGPGGGTAFPTEVSAFGEGPSLVSSYGGLPSSLFSFDATHLIPDFMQDVQPQSAPGGSNNQPDMGHYQPHSRQM